MFAEPLWKLILHFVCFTEQKRVSFDRGLDVKDQRVVKLTNFFFATHLETA